MRALWLTLALLVACGEPEAEIGPIGDDPTGFATAELPAAAHGGVVLSAGPHPIEIVASDDGAIDAYFVGEPPSDPSSLVVTVEVPVEDGPSRPTLLVYDPRTSRLRGRVRGAAVAPGPVQVSITVAGTPYRGTAPRLTIVHAEAPPGVEVELDDGYEDDDDDYVDEADVVVVEAAAPPPPQPRVVVRAGAPAPRPRVVVHAEAPRPPRPRVVIEAPGPPPPPGHRVVIQGGRRGRGHARGHRRGRRRH